MVGFRAHRRSKTKKRTKKRIKIILIIIKIIKERKMCVCCAIKRIEEILYTCIRKFIRNGVAIEQYIEQNC